MISSIEIKNFLSHKHTILDLTNGVNVLVGPTDSGKSACIKALKWVMNNRPSGDAFRSSWGGETRVDITLEEGICISRIKSDAKNVYIVGKTVFEGFGTKVPVEVTTLLNLNATNLQEQFDPHFLLSSSSGEVAAHFNKVAHLDKIDTSLKNLNSWIRQSTAKIAAAKVSIDDLEADVEELAYLPALEKRIQKLEKEEFNVNRDSQAISTLQGLLTKLQKVEEDIKDAEEFLLIDVAVQNAIKADIKIKELTKSTTELQTVISALQTLQGTEEYLVDFIQGEVLFAECIALDKKYNSKKATINELQKLVDRINFVKNKMEAIQDEVESKQTIFERSMPKKCPLCGNVTK